MGQAGLNIVDPASLYARWLVVDVMIFRLLFDCWFLFPFSKPLYFNEFSASVCAPDHFQGL